MGLKKEKRKELKEDANNTNTIWKAYEFTIV